MFLTSRFRYGLIALAEIARRESEVVKVRDIAIDNGLSVAYLERIFKWLKKSNLVESQRGCKGGYRLVVSPENISLLDIANVVEEKFSLTNCANCKKMNKVKKNGKCDFHNFFLEIENKSREFFSSITIEDFVKGDLEKSLLLSENIVLE